MTTQPHDLTPEQLDWLRVNSPSFAKANADVLRRDAEVAENWRKLRPAPAQAEPVNLYAFVKRTTYPAEVKLPIPSLRGAK